MVPSNGRDEWTGNSGLLFLLGKFSQDDTEVNRKCEHHSGAKPAWEKLLPELKALVLPLDECWVPNFRCNLFSKFRLTLPIYSMKFILEKDIFPSKHKGHPITMSQGMQKLHLGMLLSEDNFVMFLVLTVLFSICYFSHIFFKLICHTFTLIQFNNFPIPSPFFLTSPHGISWVRDLGSLTRDWTHVPFSGSGEL